MFRNTYQSGLLSLLSSVGSKPLDLWKIKLRNGSVKRVRDDQLTDSVIEILSTDVRSTCISIPAKASDELAIKLPFIVLIVKTLGKPFTITMQVKDTRGRRYWLCASNFQTRTRLNPLICTMPLRMDEDWNYVQVDLSDLTWRAFSKTFSELCRVKIHANCQLHRVFCADRVYSEDDLPPEFRLYRHMECAGSYETSL